MLWCFPNSNFNMTYADGDSEDYEALLYSDEFSLDPVHSAREGPHRPWALIHAIVLLAYTLIFALLLYHRANIDSCRYDYVLIHCESLSLLKRRIPPNSLCLTSPGKRSTQTREDSIRRWYSQVESIQRRSTTWIRRGMAWVAEILQHQSFSWRLESHQSYVCETVRWIWNVHVWAKCLSPTSLFEDDSTLHT